MSKANTKAHKITSNGSAESILITGESNWIQMRSLRMTQVTRIRPVRGSASVTVLGGG